MCLMKIYKNTEGNYPCLGYADKTATPFYLQFGGILCNMPRRSIIFWVSLPYHTFTGIQMLFYLQSSMHNYYSYGEMWHGTAGEHSPATVFTVGTCKFGNVIPVMRGFATTFVSYSVKKVKHCFLCSVRSFAILTKQKTTFLCYMSVIIWSNAWQTHYGNSNVVHGRLWMHFYIFYSESRNPNERRVEKVCFFLANKY